MFYSLGGIQRGQLGLNNEDREDGFEGSIGNNQDNKDADIQKARKKLNQAGLDAGDEQSGILDMNLIEATKIFQQRQGLKEDGIMRPNGETEIALDTLLKRQSGQSKDSKGENGGYFKADTKPLILRESIGSGKNNDKQDVMALESILAGFGLIKQGRADQGKGQMHREIVDAIKIFQKENGLRIDGVLNPDGETQETLNNRLKKVFVPQQPQKNKIESLLKPDYPDNDSLSKKVNLLVSNGKEGTSKQEENNKNKNPSHDEVFREFRERLAPREGGVANRPHHEDSGGLTNQGISQKFYDEYKKKYPNKDLPEKTTALSDEQIDSIYKKVFFYEPQINKLNDVAGYHKTGSKLVEHVFDANLMSDTLVVGRWFQESIDEVMGTNLKTVKNGKEVYDGIIGSQTRDKLKKAVESDKIKDIHKIFSNKRLNYLKSLKDFPENPGWVGRVREFMDD